MMINDKINGKLVHNFNHIYDAESRYGKLVKPSRCKPYSLDFDYNYSNASFDTIPTIEITMPEVEYARLISDVHDMNDPNGEYQMFQRLNKAYGRDWIYKYDRMMRIQRQEEQLRQRVPALQSAWDQYQFTLGIVGDY